MSNIAIKTETALDNHQILKKRRKLADVTITDAISQSITYTAMNLDADAIITATESGHSARMISKYRPKAPIVAVTFTDAVSRQLSLVWGIQAVVGKQAKSTDEMLDIAIDKGLTTKLFTRGSQVVIAAGVPVGESGTTNLMKVHVVGDILARGQGVGRWTAYGKVVVAKNAKEALEEVQKGDIIVTNGTDKDMMPAIEKAGGIITEQGGLTSHAAVVGLSLGIPVIVGVENVFDLVKNGEDITLDGSKGDIYKGHAGVL